MIEKITIVAAMAIMLPLCVYAAPAITGKSGTVASGESITITGSGFGTTGPTVLLFDEFTGTDGGVIPLDGAQVGTWTGRGGTNATYVADGADNTAALFVNALDPRSLNKTFTGTTNIFVSYRVKVPTGYHFPNAAAPGEFCPDSCWKLAWIMDNSNAIDDDICIPTHSASDEWTISGNDGGITYPLGTPNRPDVGDDSGSRLWFSFTGWNRVTTWIKGGADPINDIGKVWFQAVNTEFGNKPHDFDRYVFDGDDEEGDDATQEWDTFKIPGWYRSVNGVNAAYDSMTRAYYDDVYLATGADAAARVEIGNASTYSACTKLAIATPTSWADTSVTATVREGSFDNGDSVYLYVIDKDNAPSAGYGPITLGSGSGLRRLGLRVRE